LNAFDESAQCYGTCVNEGTTAEEAAAHPAYSSAKEALQQYIADLEAKAKVYDQLIELHQSFATTNLADLSHYEEDK
jgi:hypothetical protein